MRSSLVGRLAASVALLVGTATAVGTLATASPAAAATGDYSGSASGSLVAASAVTIPGTLQVANLAVAPTTASVSTKADLTDAKGKNSYARATNLDAQLINGTIPLNGLIVESDQAAPPDNAKPVTNKLLSVPADPLLNATVATATASARWPGADQCVAPGTPIADGTSTAATANVLTGTPLGGAAVSVVNSAGGPVTSDSNVELINVSGQSGKGLQSTNLDQLTGVVLFKGSANELTVNVMAPPVIQATVTGAPGGAKVTYTEPILQIVQGGKVVGTLDAATANTSITIPGVATLSLGTLTSKTSPDGTTASGSAVLLNVQVGVAPLPLNVANITIAGGSVAAQVPAGGVNCPNTNPLDESHKDVSSSVVAPGQQFTYTVTVPNHGTCVLVNVKVVDTITAPDGTTIVSSTPPADTTSGLTLTYNDIGPLQPNQTKNIQIIVKAPSNLANGAPFSNHADISGICQNAPAGTTPFTKGVDVSGPVGFAPAANGCHLDGSNKAADHLQVTPGESFNYYIHVLNDGTSDCTNVVVTDPLGSNVSFVSATDGGTNDAGTVTWKLGTLASGASRTVAVTVTVDPKVATGTTLPDTALIKATEEQHSVTTGGPTVTGTSVLAPPNPAGPTGGATNSQASSLPASLPRTGGHPWAPLGLGLLASGVALAIWRRRVPLVTD